MSASFSEAAETRETLFWLQGRPPSDSRHCELVNAGRQGLHDRRMEILSSFYRALASPEAGQ
jgi:hypothetical protein